MTMVSLTRRSTDGQVVALRGRGRDRDRNGNHFARSAILVGGRDVHLERPGRREDVAHHLARHSTHGLVHAVIVVPVDVVREPGGLIGR